MATKLLTDRRVRNAKPRVKPYRLFDGDGLALLISPTKAKSWQLRYRLDGKPQTATLGKADEGRMTLAEARIAAEEARKRVAAGEHLTVAKRVAKAQKAANRAATFQTVADEWVAREARRMKWTPDYKQEVVASLANHLSQLNELPVGVITAKLVSPMMNKVERSAPDMASKVRQRLRGILDRAVEEGLIQGNPLPAVRRRKAGERTHYPAFTDLPGLGKIMRDAGAADPCKGIQRAHLLLAFTAQRVGEVVGAKWEEFELDGIDVPVADTQRTKHDRSAGNWSIPRERMKRKDEARGPHVVPLPPALLALLRQWKKDDAGSTEYVCPAPRDPKRSITREAVEKFYRLTLKLAGKHGPHSWRSAFSTVSREAGKDSDAVESQLDHVVGTKVAGAYDRARRLAIRRELMAWYESTLIDARDGADVIAMRAR